jgi:ketol-acid reductoisomerase
LNTILEQIRSGEFAKGWMAEADGSQKNLEKLINGEAKHPIEKAGRRMRSLMPYLSEDE